MSLGVHALVAQPIILLVSLHVTRQPETRTSQGGMHVASELSKDPQAICLLNNWQRSKTPGIAKGWG